ncbi:flavodoxin domain-containing protein [Acetobacterium bakii]|uniref:flavodoxin domain-containing protein n=1 Tax=Acetobacterium bakii TaxID=52689 RepID=UPI000A7DC5B3|nr:flavodoxin domain-containing protein [Acetobacterium bakii]
MENKLLDKIGVIYWSDRESTEIMAEKISNGIDEAGSRAILLNVADFDPKTINTYAKIVLGCPAMEGEALEKTEFEPFFRAISDQLKGKKVALFGSHGWGNAEWMADWEKRVNDLGAILYDRGLTVLGEPDKESRRRCVEFGKEFAEF